ncbi:MAG TPA: tRNA uridine-5-carboxymethylaminomethyl(34) synthesis GTPase MnmE [Capsulimonadaceae bacterium]|jgi:tRNA modification GTPase
MHLTDDTICAQATPRGTGGIGVFRVSGAAAFAICDSVLRHRRPCASHSGHTLHRAVVLAADRTAIDDVLVAVFHAPRSYTGEDVVEISCHGGPVPMRGTLDALLEAGARLAEPGEFTFRAFMNGRMDLAQAEAVCDLIAAQTVEAHRAAQAQQSGKLSAAIEAIRDIFLGVLARIEASIDFPEDVGDLDTALCSSELARAREAIEQLLATANRGILYREGASVVLAGKPNVGKSSLMNALLRTSRAIVTAVPGTTRDVIEETLNVDGIPVRLFDTAGLRETDDLVEKLGVERTNASVETADLILAVLDSSEAPDADEIAFLAGIKDRSHIVVANKSDRIASVSLLAGAIAVSAVTGAGLDALEASIAERLTGGDVSHPTGVVVTHSRHRSALLRALAALDEADATLAAALPADLLAIDVRGAIDAVEDVTGRSTTDDIINEIFSRFCIGK